MSKDHSDRLVSWRVGMIYIVLTGIGIPWYWGYIPGSSHWFWLGMPLWVVVAVACWRRRPLVTFGLLSYWVLLIPTSSIVPLLAEIIAYRPYPSSPFLFLAIVAALPRWRCRL